MWDKPQVLNWIANLLFGFAVVMLLFSFVLLLGINGLQWWSAHRHRGVA